MCCLIALQGSFTVYNFHMSVRRSAVSLSISVVDFVYFLNFSIVMSVRWRGFGALVCILLFTRKERHFFVSFFTICFFLFFCPLFFLSMISSIKDSPLYVLNMKLSKRFRLTEDCLI